jgi:hypothetical protein
MIRENDNRFSAFRDHQSLVSLMFESVRCTLNPQSRHAMKCTANEEAKESCGGLVDENAT